MRRVLLRRGSRLVAAATTASLLALAALGSASAAIQPGGITDEARKMHDLFIIVLIFALVVFGLVGGALVYAMIRYRRRDDELPPQFHGDPKIELMMVGVPAVIVVALFVISMLTLVDIDNDADPDDLTIEVTGFQFSWQFAYNLNDLGLNTDPNAEGTVAIIGTPDTEPVLVMPVDEPVEFVLVSNDVIHSFYVRDFLYKLDLIPGRQNDFTVTAREAGDYRAQCAELCGLNHSLMRFTLRVVERAEFDAWIADQAAKQLGADAPSSVQAP